MVDLPNGRLVAMYPLSEIDYTIVVIANPRHMTG